MKNSSAYSSRRPNNRVAGGTALGIVFAVIVDSHKTSGELGNFLNACINQTVQPSKVILNFEGRSLPSIHSPLPLVLQRSHAGATLAERIWDIISNSSCSYLVIFSGSSCVPKPFFCERIGFHAAHFSPDAIFIEAQADSHSSLSYSCLGSGSHTFYAPESLALVVSPMSLKFAASNFDRHVTKGFPLGPFTALIRPKNRCSLRNELEEFNKAITQIVGRIAPELVLALGGEVICGHAGHSPAPSDNESKYSALPPRSAINLARSGLVRPAADTSARRSSRHNLEAVGKHLDLMKQALRNFSGKSFILDDHLAYSDREIVMVSRFFDAEIYQANQFPNDEILADPLSHFLERGWTKLSEFSKYFQADIYLRENDDVRRAGLNPLIHYLRYGRAEGRSRWGRNGEVSGPDESLLLTSGLFDPEYYLSQNADLFRQGVDPIWHYLTYGGLEGRSPSVYFDGLCYLNENHDIAEARMNPLLHYILYGRDEGRQIRPANETPWRARFAGRPRMTDRVEWHLDAIDRESISDWFENTGILGKYQADILCCVPYLVRDNLTLRLMDQAVERGASSLLTVQHATPVSYAEDNSSWSERSGSVLRLYDFAEEQSYTDLISHLVKSRGVKTLLIAGSADIYPMLPDLKQRFKNLFIVDQIFNTTGHTKLSLTFSPYIDRYIVESRAMKDFLLERDIDSDRIAVLTSGVNLGFFSRQEVDADRVVALRSGCGFKDSVSFVVGYVGRMSPEKNPLGFLQIVREVIGRRSDIGFLIAGSGPMLDLVREEVHRSLPAEFVSVVGFVEDVRVAMLSCDLLVLPSHVDGRPNAIMEANALGIPVLGSSIGGICELINDGTNGFLIRPGAYSDFAGKICGLADDPDQYRELRESCFKFAAENFDQTPMFDNFFRIISRSC
ncbi:glycosyltransferase family 4 protein [Methylobacterium sp. J-072]|uniref:glycosyltransferase family 4 protein n=1 Tax=Methylobacterium sp. J-072 TaxID=2836651 RepID=UPI001FB8B561|nr:glycosyltransferase family 4 protein [Methylobacterium sp. J-072]MCJ2094462.1 glycosyltransferase family 4 protein [Methylobacterium sp. J-072]